MYNRIDTLRREAVLQLDPSKRSELGQFFTPYSIASYMASLLDVGGKQSITMLDAGAGIGSLSLAFLERLSASTVEELQIIAYEFDKKVADTLKANLSEYAQMPSSPIKVIPQVIEGDFIQTGVIAYLTGRNKSIDYAILNPPYRKISSASLHRKLLRKAGIDTVNLYAGFVALAVLLLKEGGELVAIIPRSFCNGLYYRPFRSFLLEKTAIRHIHIFDSRESAFKEDGVLQENIIIHLVKGAAQGDVKISTSRGEDFQDYEEFFVPFERIVPPANSDNFIHIPTANHHHGLAVPERLSCSLQDLGLEVSTGPVVDFRVKMYLHKEGGQGTVPLIYPAHFGTQYIEWPKQNFKKSNAISVEPETEKLLFPTGYYTLVRRFSSKEEKKRIVARVLSPDNMPAPFIGLENHLNVFHQAKKGLPKELALGLAVYLNSTMVDEYFRQFNGHTQVNATDLRLIKYPDKEVLIGLGKWASNHSDFDQFSIDAKVSSLL